MHTYIRTYQSLCSSMAQNLPPPSLRFLGLCIFLYRKNIERLDKILICIFMFIYIYIYIYTYIYTYTYTYTYIYYLNEKERVGGRQHLWWLQLGVSWFPSVHLAVCCSLLQGVAVCCSVLPRVAMCCSVLQCVPSRASADAEEATCSVVQCVAVCCSVLHWCAVCCSDVQYVAACCSVLQCVAVCCRGLQRSVAQQARRRLRKSAL